MTGGLPTNRSPIAMANILATAATLIIALNVGWIKTHKK